MSWVYVQESGNIYEGPKLRGSGYSGHGDGLNNPSWEPVKGVGPIPAGVYIVGPAYTHPHLGPCVMNLDALPGKEIPFGRGLFRIHGDNRYLNHTASDGCIILARLFRDRIAYSTDRDLTVVALEKDVRP